MDKMVLEEKLKTIFELDELDLNVKFADLEEWDSLSVLSVLALLDSDYGINMTKNEVTAFPSISAFMEYVGKNAK
jgi:acyl carrier protein